MVIRDSQKSQKLRSLRKMAKDYGAGLKSNQVQSTQLQQLMHMRQFQIELNQQSHKENTNANIKFNSSINLENEVEHLTTVSC